MKKPREHITTVYKTLLSMLACKSVCSATNDLMVAIPAALRTSLTADLHRKRCTYNSGIPPIYDTKAFSFLKNHTI